MDSLPSPRVLANAPHRLLFFIGAGNVLLAMAWWTLWLADMRWHAIGLRQPAELVNHRLLSVYTARGDWALWLAAAGVGELASHPSLMFDSYLLAMEAAIDGRGVALVPDFVAVLVPSFVAGPCCTLICALDCAFSSGFTRSV